LIGVNSAEAVYAQSRNDIISKYFIALKEASETNYWIKIILTKEIRRNPC
jgi:four helix bundle protein